MFLLASVLSAFDRNSFVDVLFSDITESREGLDVSELLRATTGATCLRERAAVNDWSTRALSPL